MQWIFPSGPGRVCRIALDHQAYIRVNTYKSSRGLADPLSVTPEQYAEGFGFLVTETTSVVVEEPPLRSWFGLPEKPPNCGHTSGRLTLPNASGEIMLTPCQYRADLAQDLPSAAREVRENDARIPQCMTMMCIHHVRGPREHCRWLTIRT